MTNTRTRPLALVTGASKGIGQAIAICLARAGYDLAVHYNTDLAGARATAARVQDLGQSCRIYQADLQDLAALARMFQDLEEELGGLDLLVNNAGITRFAPFLETTAELWREVVNTDWRGSFFCAQAAARLMVAKRCKGVIINISSNHAAGCWPRASVYGPAKAAVEKMTENIALELAPYGIRVLAIAPGYTVNQAGTGPENDYIKGIKARIPAQRFARAEEIGQLVTWLASKEAGYMTGTTVTMDGGALLPVVPENTYML